jgi:predicted aspartyl protease
MIILSTIPLLKRAGLLFLILFHLNCKGQDSASRLIITGTQTTIPFILHDNRVFVKTQIGKKVFHFLLDTGGGIVLDIDAANGLQLPLTRQGEITGTGEKPAPLFRTMIDTIHIAGLQILNKDAMVISLREIKEALRLDFLDGVVGYEIFQRFITEINFSGASITLYEKETFRKPDNAYAIPFRLLDGRIPVIKMKIDGIEAEFIIDTGDRSSLTLFPKFSDENNFRTRYTLSDTLLTGYGIGGPINGQLLTIKKINLGDTLVVENTLTRIPTIRSGAFNRNDSVKGSIGNGLLKQFKKITFDYFNKVLYIEK